MESIVSSEKRHLSVHKEHEVLLKLESAGLGDSEAQAIIESKNNDLANSIVALIRKELPTLPVKDNPVSETKVIHLESDISFRITEPKGDKKEHSINFAVSGVAPVSYEDVWLCLHQHNMDEYKLYGPVTITKNGSWTRRINDTNEYKLYSIVAFINLVHIDVLNKNEKSVPADELRLTGWPNAELTSNMIEVEIV